MEETDLLAGLWEEAPFARLPLDAPVELRDLVEDVDNPKKVYAVHRAARRHNFQHLVHKYVYAYLYIFIYNHAFLSVPLSPSPR